MKHILFLIFGTLALILLQSCDHHYQYGYPETVTFPKHGGEKTISGETFLSEVSIYNSKGDREIGYSTDPINDSEFYSLTFDWLTVEHQPHTSSLTLKAQPNKTKKKRRLLIISSAGEELEIVVKQDK